MCPLWSEAYCRMGKDEAVGVDGVTKEQYGRDLERNLRDLHERMKAKRYRHQPIRRVRIPKDQGKTRPIGIGPVFEPGVRPGASPLIRYRSGDIAIPETEASPLARPRRAA